MKAIKTHEYRFALKLRIERKSVFPRNCNAFKKRGAIIMYLNTLTT